MIDTATSPIESPQLGSQARPKKSPLKSLSNRRWLPLRRDFHPRQQTLPKDQKLPPAQNEDAKNLEDATPNSYQFGVIDRKNEQHLSSLVQVATTSQSADRGVEQCTNTDARSQQERERSAMFQDHLSQPSTNSIGQEVHHAQHGARIKPQHTKTRLGRSMSHFPYKRDQPKSELPIMNSSATQLAMATPEPPQPRTAEKDQKKGPTLSKVYPTPAVVDNGEEERVTPHRVRDSIRRAKTLALGTVRAATPRFKRRIRSADQPALPSSTSDEPPHSRTTRREEKDIPTTILLHAEGKQPTSADIWDAEQTARESDEVKKLRRDLSESRSQVAELQKLCEAQSRDMESSNSFLNATDKSSDSDIIHALQRLNAEVQQSTTFMADCLAEDFEFKNVTMNQTKDQISAVQRASETIGYVLAESLGTKPLESIPMLLQIAFQAYLVSALGQTASSWVFEAAHNKFLNAIYQSLHRAEAQAVSGRWRSLARFHIIHSWVNHPEELVKGIISGFSDILLAAGCTAPQSDIISKVTLKFEQKIALLVELAVRLNKLFDEIVSSDFEILVVRPGEKFEGKNMEDTDDDQAGVQDGLVLCATHLGLIKRMPVGTLWEKGKKQKMMVLKAKVLLESFLNTED